LKSKNEPPTALISSGTLSAARLWHYHASRDSTAGGEKNAVFLSALDIFNG